MESSKNGMAGLTGRVVALALAFVTAASVSVGAATVVTGSNAPLAAAGNFAVAALAMVRGSVGL